MTLGKLRSGLYRAARVLGDVNALRRGRVARRVWNRVAGRLGARIMRRMYK